MSTFKDTPVHDAQGKIGTPDLGQTVRLFYLRRGAGSFAQALQERLADLNVKKVHWMTQSESEGNISLTCLYE